MILLKRENVKGVFKPELDNGLDVLPSFNLAIVHKKRTENEIL